MRRSADGTRLATLEELVDAGTLRSVIADALAARPVDERAVRRSVWAYVCSARDLGLPAGQVILSLTTIVESSDIAPRSVRDATVRRVILWCVDAFFGHLGERIGDVEDVEANIQKQPGLPPVRASNR